MWWLPQSILWLARRQAGSQLGFHYFGADSINNDEAFAQRINGDLHLGDFKKAMKAYQDDPEYWHRLYGDDPEFSNSHTPDAVHGGPVPPSQYFPAVPLGAGSGVAAGPALRSTPGSPTPFIDRYIRFGSAPLPNAPAASDNPANFADRFGNWAAQPAGAFGNINAPGARVPDRGERSEIPDDVTLTPTKDDVPIRRLANLSLPTPSDAPPLAPSSSPPLLRIFSSKPMRDYPVPPPIFGAAGPPSTDDDELFRRWKAWIGD
jgi:hypothetical protein